ncbi:MAG: CopG family transcriptional regulator [Candidatus Bathyarchaeia archaeon]
MAKAKTSVYVDRDLWARFKEYASKNGSHVSRKLEELIEDSLVERELDEAFPRLREGYEVDFDPVEPKGALVSGLVRVVRDERADT